MCSVAKYISLLTLHAGPVDVNFTSTSLNVTEGELSISVCAVISSVPAGGLQINIIVAVVLMDGIVTSMSQYLILAQWTIFEKLCLL